MRVLRARQQRPVLGEVAGQEDDEDDLEQLRRLARRAARCASDSRAPFVSSPKQEDEQQQPDADGRPGVLVVAQPAVAADEDRERREDHEARRRSRTAGAARGQLATADQLLRGEILRQPLHQQQREPAEQRRGREQHLVHAPAGDHERDMDGEHDAEVRDQEARRRRGSDCPGLRNDARLAQPATRSATATRTPSSSGTRAARIRGGYRARTRAARHRRASCRPRRARAAAGPGRPGARRRSPAAASPVDALAVELRAVGAAAVLDVPGTAAERQQGVLGRDEVSSIDDRVVHVAARCELTASSGIECPRSAGPRGDAMTTSRPSARPPSATRARRSRQRARARMNEEQVDEHQKEQARTIQSVSVNASIVGRAATSGRMRSGRPVDGDGYRRGCRTSPGPSAISVTRRAVDERAVGAAEVGVDKAPFRRVTEP